MADELLLIHGGLWEQMDAGTFWSRPGIVRELRRRGLSVRALDRTPRAESWTAEVDQFVPLFSDSPVIVVGASNGCSVAVRLTLQRPELVRRLILAWPATAGHVELDARTSERLQALGATPDTITSLLAGETLRGTSDRELRQLTVHVGVVPSVPEDPFHQRGTVDQLLRLMPHSVELAGCPTPLHSTFGSHLQAFAAELERFVR